ncbi:MAG: hypothetical protein EOP04_31475, partial [Proteobacteria bacterium]
MSKISDNQDLLNFYNSTLSDIRTTQIAEDEGGNSEQLFTRMAVDLLAEAGETENVRVAYDEKALGSRNQHKINGYAISENYETIDLYVTIYNGEDMPVRMSKEEIEKSVRRISNFFKKAIGNEFVHEIDESSQIFDFARTIYQSEELKTQLVRVNAIILTDGTYGGQAPMSGNIAGFPIYYRVSITHNWVPVSTFNDFGYTDELL